ncbi:SUMO1 sentrin specific peptidase 1 [Podochytrium sp. JEL0797]|nr:SUMO1 sentrin specific peptidase 1 [Podochytrium sp. JEL0797]
MNRFRTSLSRHGISLSDSDSSENEETPPTRRKRIDTSTEVPRGFTYQPDTSPAYSVSSQLEAFARYKDSVDDAIRVGQDRREQRQTTPDTNSDPSWVSALQARLQSMVLTPTVSKQTLPDRDLKSSSPYYQKLIAEEEKRTKEVCMPSASCALPENLENQIEKLRHEIAQKAKKNSFPYLTPAANDIVNRAFARQGPDPVVKGFNVDLTRADVATLYPATWLNDEIINFYGQMLMERAKRNPGGKYPKIHFFNTFFYTTLKEQGFDRIKRWSKKFDVFALDYLIIPVHLGMHWCCSVINFKDKRIEYYDSLKGGNPELFEVYRGYLQKESMDKKKVPFDFEGWVDYCPKDIPGQLNGFDCGVFTCMYAEYRSREAVFDFTQDRMPYIRRRMVHEICTKKLQFDD